MKLSNEVIERLLLSKSFLGKIRFQPLGQSDRHSLAAHIIVAHDAAELALAAICTHVGATPTKDKLYLMDYFTPLKERAHPDREVFAKDYFSQLNRVRINIKHHGIFPDPNQWVHVSETVYGHISHWCTEYLGVSLDDLDESTLLSSPKVKEYFDAAQEALERGEYKHVLGLLGKAFYTLLDENPALRGLSVGQRRPEDAIIITSFGVRANDFLALQQFLPQVVENKEGNLICNWKQSEFGHPGNWREVTARFCLDTFLDVALKIQHARWIPGAIHRSALYDDKVTAIRDGVEVWKEVFESSGSGASAGLMGTLVGTMRTEVAKVLKNGDSITGSVSLAKRRGYAADLLGRSGPDEEGILEIFRSPFEVLYVARKDVKLTCVPKDLDIIREHFPHLAEIEWEPD